MSEDVQDRLTGSELSFRQQDSYRWVKSYTYLRTAMVGLLIGLGAAVLYQTWRQGFSLASVSAYYYTPAQTFFVGALIGLGACMIALKGTNGPEEISLNLGGMFAAVVAVVPTSRGEDYRTAVRACEQLLTEQALTDLDCPDVLSLAEVTRANVETNMIALLIVGLLGLVAGLLFALRDRRGLLWDRAGVGKGAWWGFGVAFAVLLSGAITFLWSRDWFIDYAHYIAASGLLGCILVVAGANALRREGKRPGMREARDTLIRNPARLNRYAWLAWVMLVGAAIGIVLVAVDGLTLFWVEIGIALLFIVFWMAQTVDELPREKSQQASA